MNKRIVLVGAGSAQFGLGMLGDIFSSSKLRESELVLLDINKETLNKVKEEALVFLKKQKLDYSIRATTDRKEAFKGADFIIISIEVGDRFSLWEEDWKVPQQYGIKQVYGENGGPGGLFHALRIIPPILAICGDAMEICPEAQIFCYSNPMTAITTTVHRAYPGIKFTGMCHEIASLERYIPDMLGKKYEDLDLIAGGLNHFSCLLEARDRKTGKDLYPEIMEKAFGFFSREPGYSDMLDHYKKSGELINTEGSTSRSELGIKDSAYDWADRKLFRFIMENYGLLPITGDSHFGEYISWAWEVSDNRGIMDFFDFYKAMLGIGNKHEITLDVNERFVPIAEGMIDDSGYLEAAVNIPNNGLIADLPDWIAVEVPGYVGKNGIEGRRLENVPKGYAALLRNYCGAYDLLAEAVLTGKKEYAIQSLLANPVVNRATPLKEMVNRMIDRQSPWLDYLK
ncbi:MAG: alpha-glucosidase [Spirochaetaceae bacterium 4572_59]|nr:MAG: alpha-glucosidase [Spirochaetaceae bacterium 4572_59]